MKSAGDFQHFATNIRDKRLRETKKAIACLWYSTEYENIEEMSAKDVANCMMRIGLAGNVNISRLNDKLRKSKNTVKGNTNGSFRISPTHKFDVDKEFQPFVKRKKFTVSDDLLPESVIHGTRKYLIDLAHQINGTYDAEFYDACAVICRRMVESLLVEAFCYAKQLSAIQTQDGKLEMLDAIIKKAKTNNFIQLPRNTATIIDKVKEIGDTAAHDRFHITTKQDIDDFRTGFRKIISQLLGLSGINSTP